MAEAIPGLNTYGPLIAQLGGGGLIGFIMGYAVKKVLKILLVLAGIGLAGLLYLQYLGFLTVHWDKFGFTAQSWLDKIISGDGITEYTNIISSNIPFAGAFLAGLAFGLKAG